MSELTPAETEAAEALHRRGIVESAQSWVDQEAAETVRRLFKVPVVSVWEQPPLPLVHLLPPGQTPVCGLLQSHPKERVRCAAYCRSCYAKLENRPAGGICFTCPSKITNLWSAVRVPAGTVGVIGVQFRGNHEPPAPPVGGNGEIKRKELLKEAYGKLPRLDGHGRRGAAALLDLISRAAIDHGNAVVAREDLAEARERADVLKQWAEWYRARDEHNDDPSPTDLPPLAEADDRESPGHRRQLVRRVMAWVDVEYPMPVTLKIYSKRLDRSLSYLSAVFSEVVGTPFRTYVKEYRIRKAQVILRTQRRMPIAEVGYAVGYTDPNSFLRAFREMTGVCPSKWRVCAD